MRATRPRRKKSFEELISGYYGRGPGDSRTFDEVLANYYGRPSRPRATSGAASLALSRDDGEVLPQAAPAMPADTALPPAPSSPAEEYVVWSSDTPATPDTAPAPAAAPPTPAAPPAAPAVAAASLAADVAPAEEYAVDLYSPLEPPPVRPSGGSSAAPRALEEDELAADMQAILSGQKVYDPASGRTVDRDSLGAQPQPQPGPAPASPQFANEHSIFDAIRESMTYANAYDLGEVELENRFADFDRTADVEQQRQAAAKERRTEDPKVGGAEFLEDLDAIRARAEDVADDAVKRAMESMPKAYTSSIADWSDSPIRDASCEPSALKLSLAEPLPGVSSSLWDTGEHALTGGDLYPNQLRVGRGPGVSFSYGELIAMGDFFASADEMMGADPAELTRLKALIDRNTEYYRQNKSQPSLDVSHTEWERATNGRYLKLAEDNYEHFSPNTLFDDAFARAAAKRGNNRTAWEAYHRRAIEEAQKLALLPENQNRSYVPEWPLVLNAFGDHFLTDAFASGHLISKELMIALFKKNFFSGGSLTDAADDFFERVADAAYVGDVKAKFSKLEPVQRKVCALGWCLPLHPNIRTAGMFKDLLVAAAESEPEKVANFAVKALHDVLNEQGIEVTNAAGDGKWKLTGDGHINPKSLAVMRKAVQQSVDNVNDPSILQSNLDFGALFDRVWRYVPQPTAPERARLKGLVQEYTNPRSKVLSSAAAKVIRDQVDSMIDVLVKEGHLRPD